MDEEARLTICLKHSDERPVVLLHFNSRDMPRTYSLPLTTGDPKVLKQQVSDRVKLFVGLWLTGKLDGLSSEELRLVVG